MKVWDSGAYSLAYFPSSYSDNKNSLPLQTKNAIWLGWRDSNPRMTGPEPVALPLGDTPSLQNTVAQAGVVFKLFVSKPRGFL